MEWPTGAAKIKLDERGRLAVPTRFRAAMSGGEWVQTGHPHGCLYFCARARLEEIAESIGAHGSLGYSDGHLEETIVGHAEPIALDSAGRILLSPVLRQFARIERAVIWFGLRGGFRIWDEAQWERKNQMIQARIQDEGFSQMWREIKI